MTSKEACVWIIDGHMKESFFAPLLADFPAQVKFVTSARAVIGPNEDVDLFLINDETWPYCAAALAECRRRSIPSLHIADGILEWFNLWHNPRTLHEEQGSPLFQPILSDKIACIGPSQARFLEALGNVGKCEVTGAPRFDNLLKLSPRRRLPNDPVRILVATARTPGFTARQIRSAEESIVDLKHWFDTHPKWDGTRIIPEWRLTGGLEKALRIDSPGRSISPPDLAEQFGQVDVVITTPSTLQLEAMLVGLPVVLLDYANRPHLLPSAFTITSSHHLEQVMSLVLDPPLNRLWLQQTILKDALECSSAATPRVIDLANRMVKIGRYARRRREPLSIPESLLPRTLMKAASRNPFVPSELNPGHPILLETNLAELQAEVSHLRRALRLKPSQIIYRALCEAQKLIKEMWRT